MEDHQTVKALAADGTDEALGKGVGPWSSDRCLDDPDALGGEDLLEARCELDVPVTDQELGSVVPIIQDKGQVRRLLGHPEGPRNPRASYAMAETLPEGRSLRRASPRRSGTTRTDCGPSTPIPQLGGSL